MGKGRRGSLFLPSLEWQRPGILEYLFVLAPNLLPLCSQQRNSEKESRREGVEEQFPFEDREWGLVSTRKRLCRGMLRSVYFLPLLFAFPTVFKSQL